MSIQEKLFGFNGRLRRRDWWLFMVLLIIVSWVLQMIVNSVGGLGAGSVPSLVVGLILLWPSLALSIKRGHDRNRPAIWIIGAYAAICVLQVVGLLTMGGIASGDPTAVMSAGGPTMIIGLITLVICLWLLIDLGFLDGTPGPNNYGPSPKGLAAAA